MKNILVATDGSVVARKAVRTAAGLAKSLGAKLTIINVQDSRPLGSAEQFAEVEFADRLAGHGAALPKDLASVYARLGPVEVATIFTRQSAAVHQAVSDAILLTAKRDAASAGTHEVETISMAGDAAHEIVEAAKRLKADLIVVGNRGLGGLSALLGSVSRKVLHRAQTDVLTVV